MVRASSTPPAGFVPSSAAEQRRVRPLLDGISTRTMLLSLLELTRGTQDAHLIIAALLDRLPLESGVDEPSAKRLPTCP